jgi:hypothetical protein
MAARWRGDAADLLSTGDLATAPTVGRITSRHLAPGRFGHAADLLPARNLAAAAAVWWTASGHLGWRQCADADAADLSAAGNDTRHPGASYRHPADATRRPDTSHRHSPARLAGQAGGAGELGREDLLVTGNRMGRGDCAFREPSRHTDTG